MTKASFTFLITFLITVTISTTASAHTGMEHSSFLHSAIHIISTVSIYLAIIGAGFYLFRKLPKAKRVRIKK